MWDRLFTVCVICITMAAMTVIDYILRGCVNAPAAVARRVAGRVGFPLSFSPMGCREGR